MKLQEELVQKQKQEQLTDGQMAAKLGVHRVTYVNVKNGKRPMSPAIRESIIRAYPELQGIFLSEITTLRSKG